MLGAMAGAGVGASLGPLLNPVIAEQIRKNQKQVLFIGLDGGMSQLGELGSETQYHVWRSISVNSNFGQGSALQ